MLRLYTYFRSSAAYRVRIALALSVACDIHQIGRASCRERV